MFFDNVSHSISASRNNEFSGNEFSDKMTGFFPIKVWRVSIRYKIELWIAQNAFFEYN